MPDLPPIRRESSDERKHAIAMAARAIIVEKGLEGLRTRDIAQRVGINIATLHYHVPSKDALIALVAASIRNEFRDQAIARPREGKNGLELLRMEFEDFRETVVHSPERFIVMTELIERARRDSAVDAIMRPMTGFWRNQMRDILAAGIADGSFRPNIDPVAGSTILVGALSAWRFSAEVSAAIDAVFAELERAFVRTHNPED
jgi:AcrR family transcriptional regulator